MRVLRTILLSLLAVILIVASVFLTIDGNLSRLTGWYRFEKGGLIFRDQQAQFPKVNWMRVADLHDTIEARRERDGSWWICSPFHDRMDPRAVNLILNFTAQTSLVDTLPYTRELRRRLREFGVESAPVRITLKEQGKGASDRTIARYTLGSTSPWLADVGDGRSVTPTTYMRTDFYGRDKRVHVVTGNILSLFQEGLHKLRDQSPLRFEAEHVLSVSLRRPGGVPLVLERRGSGWFLSAPTPARADAAQVEALLSNLAGLRAVKTESAENVRLPEIPEEDLLQISLSLQGRTEPVVLSIYPAEGEGEPSVQRAVVSDRPAVFTLKAARTVSLRGAWTRVLGEAFRLPVLPKAAWSEIRSRDREVAVSELELDPEDLRSRQFAEFKPEDIERALIRFKFSEFPLRLLLIPADKVGRMDDHWMVSASGRAFIEAAPERVDAFLKSFSQLPVAGFAADARSESERRACMEQYGLSDPAYIVIFARKPCPLRAHVFGYSVPLIRDRSPLTFLFGRAADGEGHMAWYGMAEGSDSIYRVRPRLVSFLSMSEDAWKSRRMCSFALSNVKSVSLRYQKATLRLDYDYLGETWTGTLDGEDVTARVNPNRANYYLKTLQTLQVGNWLDSSDGEALDALRNPVFSVSLSLEIPDYSNAESIVVEGHEGDLFSEGDSEIDKRLRDAALTRRTIRRKTVTIEIAPSEEMGKNSFFYGRIRETGQLFMLPVDRALRLDGGVLDM